MKKLMLLSLIAAALLAAGLVVFGAFICWRDRPSNYSSDNPREPDVTIRYRSSGGDYSGETTIFRDGSIEHHAMPIKPQESRP